MHSRIIQLETVPAVPAMTPDSIDSDHWFLNQHADYIADDPDRAQTLEMFFNCFTNIYRDTDEHGDYVVFHEDSCREFMQKRYDAFMAEFAKFRKALSLNTFETDFLDWYFYLMKESFNDTGEIYIANNFYGFPSMLTLMQFMRNHKTDTTYYIKSTFDYHF